MSYVLYFLCVIEEPVISIRLAPAVCHTNTNLAKLHIYPHATRVPRGNTRGHLHTCSGSVETLLPTIPQTSGRGPSQAHFSPSSNGPSSRPTQPPPGTPLSLVRTRVALSQGG